MINRLFFLVFAALVAWSISPYLSDIAILGLVSVAAIAHFLVPHNIGEQDPQRYVEFVFWLAIIWFTRKYIGMFFGAFFPNARRYGETKLVRCIQALTFECIYMVIPLTIIGALAILITPLTQRPLEKTVESYGWIKSEGNASDQTYYVSDVFFPDLKNESGFIKTDRVGHGSAVKLFENYVLGWNHSMVNHYIADLYGVAGYFTIDNGNAELHIPASADPYSFARTYTNVREIDDYFVKVGASLKEDAKFKSSAKAYFVLWSKMIGTYWWFMVPLALIISMSIGNEIKPILLSLYKPILNFLDKGKMGYGGSARFAGYMEEWSYFRAENRRGLYLGKSLYNPFSKLFMQDKRHMLTIASSRGGKGVSAIIPNLLTWEGSCVVIDPKGSNAAVTARKRREMGQNVYIINPFEASAIGAKTDTFDPFEGFDVEANSIHRDIDFIVDAIVMVKKDEKGGDHWTEGAKTVLRGFIAHILTHEKEPSLASLRNLFSLDDEGKAELFADMVLNESAGKIAMETGTRIVDGIHTDEIKNILSNANAQTEWLRSGDIQSVLSPEPTFKFKELKEKPTTVYLVIPPEEIKRNPRFIRLFINLMIREVYKGSVSKTPILTLMDEFPELGRMEEVVSAFAVAAGYNLTLWPFAQSLQQLDKHYKDDIETIVGNCRAVQVFNVADPKTTEFVSKRLGTRALVGSSEATTSTNSIPLRGASDVATELGEGSDTQYILRAGQPALLLQKTPYYKKTFVEKITNKEVSYDPDPNHVE